jgi:hypothetical protein
MTDPKLLLIPGQGTMQTVNIIATVSANTTLTVCSPLISKPFIFHSLWANFVLNQQHQLRIYPYISPDDSIPTTLPLTGINILSLSSPVFYLSGDGDSKEIQQHIFFATGSAYCKCFCHNLDGFDHLCDVRFYIEIF